MAAHDKDDPLLPAPPTNAPASPGRRAFMAFAGVSAGATLLATGQIGRAHV